MLTAYFKNIRQHLLFAINNVNEEVYIAVAWFTNKDLYNSLLHCLGRGIKVHLVINFDYINCGEDGLDFQNFINLGGLLYYANQDEPIHHKFCIFDKKLLYTGSYNWTYYAENRNYENILRIEEDSSTIIAFALEFKNIIATLNPIKIFIRIGLSNDNIKNFNYLGADYYYRAQETLEKEYYLKAKELIGNCSIINRKVLKEAEILYSKLLKTHSDIGIRTTGYEEIIRNSYANSYILTKYFFDIIIPQSSQINQIFTKKFQLEEDENNSLTIEFFKGKNQSVYNNEKIGKFVITKFPKYIPTNTVVCIQMKVTSEHEIIAKVSLPEFELEYQTIFIDRNIIDIYYERNDNNLVN